RVSLRLSASLKTCARRLREHIIPSFAGETDLAATEDLTTLDDHELLNRVDLWTRRTLFDFARESLKPTVLAGFLMTDMEKALARKLGAERGQTILAEFILGIRPDPEADLARAWCDLAAQRIDRSEFLRRFGHRGSHEMELAEPRWAEAPAALDSYLKT